MLAGLDVHVAADRQALAAERRLDRECSPVDGERGRLQRVLQLDPQPAHPLDALAQMGHIWQPVTIYLAGRDSPTAITAAGLRASGLPAHGIGARQRSSGPHPAASG